LAFQIYTVKMLRPIFIGRKAELERFNKLLQGEKGVVIVTGEPGIGKSQLLKEFCRQLRDIPDFLVGFYTVYASDGTFDPYVGVLGEILSDIKRKQELDEKAKSTLKCLGIGLKKVLIDKRNEFASVIMKGVFNFVKNKLGEKVGNEVLSFLGEVYAETMKVPVTYKIGKVVSEQKKAFIRTFIELLDSFTEET